MDLSLANSNMENSGKMPLRRRTKVDNLFDDQGDLDLNIEDSDEDWDIENIIIYLFYLFFLNERKRLFFGGNWRFGII